jgi:hypothetical protein
MTSKNTKIIEKKVSNILFSLCFFITLIVLAMSLIRFFSRGEFPPSQISFFYIGILIIYSIHKEALRWLLDEKEEKKHKKGEYFVYAWIVIAALLYLINFVSRGYFQLSPTGQELHILTEITIITLEVGAVFVLARVLKIIAVIFMARGNKKA